MYYILPVTGQHCTCGQPAAARLVDLRTSEQDLFECRPCLAKRPATQLVLAYTWQKEAA